MVSLRPCQNTKSSGLDKGWAIRRPQAKAKGMTPPDVDACRPDLRDKSIARHIDWRDDGATRHR